MLLAVDISSPALQMSHLDPSVPEDLLYVTQGPTWPLYKLGEGYYKCVSPIYQQLTLQVDHESSIP